MDFRNSAKNYFDLKASGSRVDFQNSGKQISTKKQVGQE